MNNEAQQWINMSFEFMRNSFLEPKTIISFVYKLIGSEIDTYFLWESKMNKQADRHESYDDFVRWQANWIGWVVNSEEPLDRLPGDGIRMNGCR